ncbi:MAG: PHP-associated domain-containing protein [Candidatus Heimdallarchaeota archaeon]
MTKTQYFVIDPHVHTPYSTCARTSFLGLLSWASRKNLNGLVVTDHDTFRGFDKMKKHAKSTEITIYRGIEVSTLEGHLLIFGGTDVPPSGQLRSYEILDQIKDEGGVAIAAHPFRYQGSSGFFRNSHSLGDLSYKLDINGVELNASCSKHENDMARVVAKTRDLALLGGSDAHRDQDLGKLVTGFYDRIEDEAALIQAIRSRRSRPLAYY